MGHSGGCTMALSLSSRVARFLPALLVLNACSSDGRPTAVSRFGPRRDSKADGHARVLTVAMRNSPVTGCSASTTAGAAVVELATRQALARMTLRSEPS